MGTRFITIVSYGILAAIIGLNPVLLIIGASMNKGLTIDQVISWTFGCYVFAGLIGILLSWKTRLPICGSQSVPAAVLLGTALSPFTWEQAAGSYLAAGLLMLILGVTGAFTKVIDYVPIEIVMAMFAGTMMKFSVGIVNLTQQHVVVGLSCLAGFLLFHVFLRNIPAPLGGILFGGIAAWMQGDLQGLQAGSLWIPTPIFPEFSFAGILSLSIPMVVLILGTEGVQGISGLKLGGYEPPVNKMVTTSGVGTILSSLFGGHSANTAGIMTTVCADPEVGRLEDRYQAAIITGGIMLLFGLFSGFFIPVMTTVPRYLIDLFTGIALLPILMQSLTISFGTEKHQFSTFAAFAVALSGVTILGISAPLWSMLLGILLMLLLEKKPDRPERAR
ncbi:benzoate/H(+) symporter BenE family transporter [Brevibacillus sp. H7]|uniref:benzoate/H(+) symporter BenE family transporter n=1 Tax=Brevibacillus sp. H7 TaxID=3349138 RepID=UPI0038222CC1